MPQNDKLRRLIALDRPNGEVTTIKTVKDALKWIELHTDRSDPGWMRAAQALTDAKNDGSLRKLRAATRAFEDTLRQAGRDYGKVDCKRP